MHGQHCEERQQQWHMRPGPSQHPVLATVVDSPRLKCFSKGNRKITVGDCALFEAGNAPPFIGLIRNLFSENEGNLKLTVNWLYRPAEVKLGKGVSLEAAPNEIFYSFHRDNIPAALLIHPCKVAFLQKGDKLPSRVLSFVCRRVYDIPNKSLYWLTDNDYTNDRQEEVNQLLNRTKLEMQAAVQSGGSSQRVINGPNSSQQPKADIGSNAGFTGQGKGKKRERTDQSMDPCKRERPVKLEDSDTSHSKRDNNMKHRDLTNLTDKDGGLSSLPGVDQLVQVMRNERNDTSKKSVDATLQRTRLASIIASTDRVDCLTRFVQLGSLLVLDDWLQEAHKGRVGDGGSPKDGDKSEELVLTLLKALDKLPVDFEALRNCQVGKSVNSLRFHRNSEIQMSARKLVEMWKKRVDAEMNLSGEGKTGSNSATAWSSKQPLSETHGTKGRSITEAKSTAGLKHGANGSCPSDTKCGSTSVSGSKESPVLSSSTVSKDNPVKSHVSGTSDVLVTAAKEEKSSSSSQSQSNSQSWCSGPVKVTGPWKEDARASSVVSTGTNLTSTALRSHGHSGKSHLKHGLTGSQKELPGSKHSVWNKISGNEKVSNSPSLEKGIAESVHAENSINQRLIVRLPNPGRSPAHSVSGGSFVEGTPASRGSSPGSLERYESVDGKGKTLFVGPAANSPESSGDVRSGCGNGSSGKSGVDCIDEKENCVANISDDVECKFSDAEHRSKETDSYFNSSNLYTGKCPPDIAQVDVVKSVTSALPAALASNDKNEEMHCFDTNDSAIDLLASVAACEGSEIENSISQVTEFQNQLKDVNNDSVKQTRHPNELEVNQVEDLLVVTLEDDDKPKKESLATSHIKGLSDQAYAGESRDPGSHPTQHAKRYAGDVNEQLTNATLEQSLDQRCRSTPSLPVIVSADCSNAQDMNAGEVRGNEAIVSNQDCCVEPTATRRETMNGGKGTQSRLSTDICNSSSLTGDCRTGTVSAFDDVDIPEGIEDAKQVATSSLQKTPLSGDAARAGDMVSGYYEEDALEVACQVAKEVEQELEQYGKPEAHEINSTSVLRSGFENPISESAKKSWGTPHESDAVFEGNSQDRGVQDAAIYSDDSQETVTEKREEMEACRMLSVQDEEVDQVAGSLHNPDKMRPALESSHGSIIDDAVNKEMAAMASSKENSQSSSVAVQEGSLDPTVCNLHSAQLGAISKDAKCGSGDGSGRPVFDLNEGFFSDEVLQDDTKPTVASLNSTVPASDAPSGQPSMSSSLAAPITVVAAAKGAFNPPSNLLRNKAELGWKGSAATSAFRPAEPRRPAETIQLSSDIPVPGAAAEYSGQCGKRTRLLDIDLNVADDRTVEDVQQNPISAMPRQTTAMEPGFHLPVGSLDTSSGSGFLTKNSSTAVRQELDLNRVDESEESMASLMLDPRSTVMRSNDNFSTAMTPKIRDFDLNDGLCLEEPIGEDHPSHYSNAKNLENPTLAVLPGMRPTPELVNVGSWYSSANPRGLVVPAFSVSRSESLPVVAAPTSKNVISVGHSLSPFSNDLYRAGAVMSSSPPVSFPSTVPATFPYAGFPFGSGFPFTSASYNMNSTPFVTSSKSPAFPTTPHLVSAGAVVSPYGRPYLMGTDVPGTETSVSWSRPSLDLNAGPDAVDVDAREEGFGTRQIPALGQLSFQQAGSSGASLKRKDPEGGFDPFRSGFKQMTWR